MAGKPDAALAVSRSDGGEQARLRSVLRRDQGRGNAVALELSAYEVNELQVGPFPRKDTIAARRIAECD